MIPGKRSLAMVCALIFSGSSWAVTAPEAVPQESEHSSSSLDAQTLDVLLAPIALYPDEVLAQVLMAASYPLDIVEANRWRQQHEGWTPDALEAAAQSQRWDPSVKALLPFGELMGLLDQNIGWTEQLGEAFLAQRADIADSVQRLRHRAMAQGTLTSNPEAQVSEEGTDLQIAPTNTDVVYVPVYTAQSVYGPDYLTDAPVVFAVPPGGIWVEQIYWCAPILGAGWLWGNWDWHRRDVEINLPRYNNAYNPHRVSPVWGFVAEHRRGIAFHLAALRAQYRFGPGAALATGTQPSSGLVNPQTTLDAQRLYQSGAWQSRPRSLATEAPKLPTPAAGAIPRSREPGTPGPALTAAPTSPVGALQNPPGRGQVTRPAANATTGLGLPLRISNSANSAAPDAGRESR